MTASSVWSGANCTPAQLVALALLFTKGWTDKHPAPIPGLVYQANASVGDRWRTRPDGSFSECCGPLPVHKVGFEVGQAQWLGFEQYPNHGFAWSSRGGSLLHALPIEKDNQLVGYRLMCNPAAGLPTCHYMRVAEKLGIVWTTAD